MQMLLDSGEELENTHGFYTQTWQIFGKAIGQKKFNGKGL
jgi:hypothetical protein